MRTISCGRIKIYKFEELKRESKNKAISRYYNFNLCLEKLDLSEQKKIKDYFEGVEFFEDGTVYEEI